MSDLVLQPPAPIAAIPSAAAAGTVPIDGETRAQLDIKVEQFISELLAIDPESPAFGAKADQLSNLGQREIAALAGRSSRFLDRPTRVADGAGGVGNELVKLRKMVEELDPGRMGDLLEPRRILGIIPFGSKLKTYFDQYAPAQAHIEAILRSLSMGRDELLQDNVALESERTRMWEMMGKLEQMIHISKTLDSRLEIKAAALEATDPAKSRAVRDSALFYIRQRTTDLLTQMAVAVQGYLALDLIRKNNIELIKGVDRASTTTVSALRTAVMVAEALANQKLVLDRISGLNASTSNMIEDTSSLLHENSGRIHELGASATIQVASLQRAFANIYATMDAVDAFKLKALDNMKQTVELLSAETIRARDHIARSDEASAGKAVAGPSLDLA